MKWRDFSLGYCKSEIESVSCLFCAHISKKYVLLFLSRINGLKAIIVSDREGVPLLRLSVDSKYPEIGTKQPFLATFSIATEQASKIDRRIGKNKSIISIYKSTVVRLYYRQIWILNLICISDFQFQVVQMNKSPLVLTFVGSENLNAGHVMSLENEFDKYLEDYKAAVVEHWLVWMLNKNKTNFNGKINFKFDKCPNLPVYRWS